MNDPISEIINCVHRLGGSIASSYDVVETSPGQTEYAYIVDVNKRLPDNTHIHKRFFHVNMMVAYEEAMKMLVRAIEEFNIHHPGY